MSVHGATVEMGKQMLTLIRHHHPSKGRKQSNLLFLCAQSYSCAMHQRKFLQTLKMTACDKVLSVAVRSVWDHQRRFLRRVGTGSPHVGTETEELGPKMMQGTLYTSGKQKKKNSTPVW